MNERALQTLWEETRSLRPIVQSARQEVDRLRHLPSSIVNAFAERDVNRLLLPEDLGGRGIDPLTLFDLIEEVASYDGSVGWNYAVMTNGSLVAGGLAPDTARSVFSRPEDGVAGSGAPQGRAVRVDGGYRVTGKFAWASGIHQATWALGGCFVYDGNERATGLDGAPVVIQAVVPKHEARILDTWYVGGLRGTGSTEFVLDDVFLPEERALTLYSSEPKHSSPLYRLPPTFFGFAISAVPLGIARAAVEGLKDLAHRKTPPPPRLGLADQASTQYAIAKAHAMTNAARLGIRDAFAVVWRDVCTRGETTMESRANMRAAMTHSVETCATAVQLCYRIAGGSALFEDEPFERALRDVNAASGHLTLQQAAMEDAGRVMLGLPPILGVF